MNIPIQAQELVTHLQADIAACESLLELLEQERSALGERDTETIEALLEQKAEQLSILEASAQTRTRWSKQYLSADAVDQEPLKRAWQSLLDQAEHPQLVQLWEHLKELQQACKAANEVNGKILARNQKTFGRLLEIVRGQTATPKLYSAAGKSTASHISQKVGEA
ncbi:flagella synthesis protein FlgN [Alteromonadaceae bacterium Bs31]|nr:flagella synthesis protein FlgN [Alteromonadaceae bacterium Bs31]